MKSTIAKSLLLALLFLGIRVQSQDVFIKGKDAPNFLKVKQQIKDLEKEAKEEAKEKRLSNSKASKERQEEDGVLAKANRYQWFWETRVSKEGFYPRPDYLTEVSKQYTSARSSIGLRKETGPTWSFLGPSTTPGGYSGLGRVSCLTFHPTDAHTYWIGSPAGGIWKTTDDGITWTALTDKALPVLGVSDIAVNPNNPDTMYIATGDGDNGGFYAVSAGRSADTHSIGVMKSTDGGTTWQSTGLTYQVSQQAVMRRIIINPTNPQILLVATSNGIFRTTNGGTTWSLAASGAFTDVQFKPGSPSIVYAASHGFGAQVYKSTNGGSSFSAASSFSGVSRIALGVTPANSSVVDALCSNSSGGFAGLYRSTNSGTSFSVLYADNNINLLNNDEAGSGTTGQGFYDLCYAISPSNINDLYVGGVNTWKSTDGGNTWDINTYWTSGTLGEPTVHADKHWIAFNPNNSSQMFQCNDGGVYVSNDGATTWLDISNGLAISQIYRLSCSATNPNNVVIGMQDNGSRQFDGFDWNYASGGDGMNCIIDPVDSSVYTSYVYGSFYHTPYQGSTVVISDNIPGSPKGAWLTPFVLDPASHETIYAGLDEVYKSTDQGLSWTAISSGNLSGGSPLTHIAIAPSNSNVLVTGDFYSIDLTNNGGNTWTNIGSGLPGGAITYVAISSTDDQTMWVSFSGYTSGSKVYQTTNGGSTWTNISTGIPNIPVNCIIHDKNSSNNRLFIGTDLGVFYKDDGMTAWEQFGTDLPNVVVAHLDIQYSAYKLRAATYGRGCWEIDLSNLPVIAPTAHATGSAATICQNKTVSFNSTSTGSITNYSWDFGTGASPATAATKGPHSVSYSSAGIKTVKLKVDNSAGADSAYVTVTVNASLQPPVISYDTTTLKLTCVAIGATSYQWKVGGTNIPGATSSTLQLKTTDTQGIYTCLVSDGGVCTGLSNGIDVKFKSKNGINTVADNASVLVYPNPANSLLNIHQNLTGYAKAISLVSITGQNLVKKTLEKDDETLDLSKFSDGIYFIKLDTPTGYLIKKIQIKH